MSGYQNPCDKSKLMNFHIEKPVLHVLHQIIYVLSILAFLSSLESNEMDFKYFLTEE